MSDFELAKALNMDESELLEAFGYTNGIDDTEYTPVVDEAFREEEYALDTDGLHLVANEKSEIYANNCDKNASSIPDEELAAMFGYFDHVETDSSQDTDAIAAAHGYDDHSGCSIDDQELLEEFGYSDCALTTSTDCEENGSSSSEEGDCSSSTETSSSEASSSEASSFEATSFSSDNDSDQSSSSW